MTGVLIQRPLTEGLSFHKGNHGCEDKPESMFFSCWFFTASLYQVRQSVAGDLGQAAYSLHLLPEVLSLALGEATTFFTSGVGNAAHVSTAALPQHSGFLSGVL